MIDKRTINILMLSIGFMLVFVSLKTMNNILVTLISSIKKENADYYGDAFFAFAIVYAVFALLNFLAPPIINVLGARVSIPLGSIAYAFFIGSFFIASGWALYVGSVVLGIGAAIIWPAQGTYLTLNSDAKTVSRNAAMFWATFQCSTLFGNAAVYFLFQGQNYITSEIRHLIYAILTGTCLMGVAVLMLLRPPLNEDGEKISKPVAGPLQAFTRAFSLLFTADMSLLCVSFFFSGAHSSFAGSVYSGCVGFTNKISTHPKSLIGILGIVHGLGEVLGGASFGLLANVTKFNARGRNPIVIFGAVVLLVTYVLIYLNLPSEAKFEETNAISVFDPPIAWLAIFCSFLLGLGDSCFHTQIYSILASLYHEDSAPSFALLKFIQSVASSIAFLTYKYIPLHTLLTALAVINVLAAVTFFPVERKARALLLNPTTTD